MYLLGTSRLTVPIQNHSGIKLHHSLGTEGWVNDICAVFWGQNKLSIWNKTCSPHLWFFFCFWIQVLVPHPLNDPTVFGSLQDLHGISRKEGFVSQTFISIWIIVSLLESSSLQSTIPFSMKMYSFWWGWRMGETIGGFIIHKFVEICWWRN